MKPKISQAEARRLQKRVKVLEEILRKQRSLWWSEWPGGVNIGSTSMERGLWSAIKTARRLEHAVVVSVDSSDAVAMFYALPIGREK